MSSQVCPTTEKIESYLDGTLPEGEADELVRHVDNCQSCERTIGALEGRRDDLVDLLRSPVDPEPAAQLSEPDYRDAVARALVSSSEWTKNGAPEEPPSQLGRYRVVRTLGSGAFGVVYSAYDENLDRSVVVKVPHPHRCNDQGKVQSLLKEARILARLDHAGIVKVFDAGQTREGRPFVVFQDVDAVDLSDYLRQNQPSPVDTARLVAEVADALHFAHQNGIVHRDIKPSNILIDVHEKCYVADFGLALREVDFGSGPGFAGTPVYMSPEQARGESHRVDGRTDIFSLGVLCYEMLCRRLPFSGNSRRAILKQISSSTEARPPRQVLDQVPKELERICLKAIAKRMVDRYTTAKDMAEDLRRFLHQAEEGDSLQRVDLDAITDDPAKASGDRFPRRAEDAAASELNRSPAVAGHRSDLSDLAVVPKGLRSFDGDDVDFFLGLLPGPRDRDGMPESLRFWKNRIERTEAWQTFSVGVVYGPSGCGKSSLIKAGLVPHLAADIAVIYVESTSERDETAILRRFQATFSQLPEALGLAEAMAWLRRYGGQHPSKVLLILDQFEQWLHGWDENFDDPLVRALRQCDGSHVQTLIVVRDDFWMATTRWMRELEVRLREADNCAAVDLFSQRHARNVLAAFGRAYGALPQGPPSEDQEEFLRRAVRELSEGGKIICLHLALFAMMMESREWTTQTLESFGGAKQIGVAFLQSTFEGRGALATCRYHQEAARRVLRSLLPPQRLGIKRPVRSQIELQQLAGYGQRQDDFEQLIHLLDGQLRLITPCDETARIASDPASVAGPTTSRRYQLTHDFLVPALRVWLTLKQNETARGRAEICLAERTRLWHDRREPRQLPSSREWRNIALLTRWANWSSAERETMRAATKRYASRSALAAALLVLALLVAWPVRSALRRDGAESITRALLYAQPNRTAVWLEKLPDYARETERLLRDTLENSEDAGQRLRTAVGLARLGDVQRDLLIDAIAWAPQLELASVATSLDPIRADANEQLFKRLHACLSSIQASETANDRRSLVETAVRYAAIQLYLGDVRATQVCMRLGADQSLRAEFIQALGSFHGDLKTITRLASESTDTDLQSGLCLALGTLRPTAVSDQQRAQIVEMLQGLYLTHHESVVRSAARWGLDQWEMPVPPMEPQPPSPDRNWFVNGLGITMVELPPGEFIMGETPDFVELRLFEFGHHPHRVNLTRPFSISAMEVTVKSFQAFLSDPAYPMSEKPAKDRGTDRLGKDTHHETTVSPTVDCPMNRVSWHDAILFCNWLSLREGRQPCYHRADSVGPPPSPVNHTVVWECDFQANGYRLPTEAEWEYACRAGSRTRFYFGNDHRKLPDYAILNATRAQPVGSRIPNGWGLFDMHGNVTEWCWDRYRNHRMYPPGDVTDPRGPDEGAARVLRDRYWSLRDFGLFLQGMRYLHDDLDYRDAHIGFRVVCQ